MRVRWKAGKARCIVAVCLVLTLVQISAQKPSPATPAESARTVLVEKAHALEARGRPDMAVQLWQQILLSAPTNAEALAGLARDYKLMGKSTEAEQTLDRLRRINPNDPNIARVESLSSTSAESDQLKKAGEFAKQGRNDDAMRIYRQLYGNQPPNGEIALAYYQTLYGSSGGRQPAIEGMRALVDRNPGDARYAVTLGAMLTYDSHTRAEGIRILRAHPTDPVAQEALRKALIWDSANPASAPEMRNYLKTHPQDSEVAGRLKQNEQKLAQMNSGIARTSSERAAFEALNAKRLDEANQRFTALLDQDPNNGRLLAGMGFLRMRQQNFGGAIDYLTRAEENGYKTKIVTDGLATSRFWFTMSEAEQAVAQNQYDAAAARYRAALDANPRSADALNGLAGLYVKERQYAAAAAVYEQLVKLEPASPAGWRGLFLAAARAEQYEKALTINARMPAAVKTTLNKDPEYLRTLAAVDQALGRSADAERVLAAALQLPFPGNGSTLQADTKMQYAGILMQAKRFQQAAALYQQVLTSDSTNGSAWMGLISAHHQMGQDTQAIDDVQRIPPATYEKFLADPEFLAELGAIYQQANQFDVAQGMFERARDRVLATGHQPSVSLQMSLAGIYLRRNNTDQAYTIYQQVLTSHPEIADAWKGLIAALTVTNRTTQALEEIGQIPASVRQQLEADITFLQSEAGLYAATGDTAHAMQLMSSVQAYYARNKLTPPPEVDVQNAWLLYNTGNDRALYGALMRIGGRNDLTLTQRETVQSIWANWSVRRAATAMENGSVQRAVDILDAAIQAFPNNLAVRKAVAGGYARVGRGKEALAIYKTVPMQNASAGDFVGAVGAALAANDKNQAEVWLRQALERYSGDPEILSLAGRYEQARGDNERAADYYRASLAAMPSVSPVDRLAHELVYPEQDLRTRRAVTAADLQQLLNPDYETFPRTVKLPPPPAYGPDPYQGTAPVVTPQARPSGQTIPASSGPDSHDLPLPPPPAQAAPLEQNLVQPARKSHIQQRLTSQNPAKAGALVSVSGAPRMLLSSWRGRPAALRAQAFHPIKLSKPAYYRTASFHLVNAAWTQPRHRALQGHTVLRKAAPRRPAIQAAASAPWQTEIVPNSQRSMASDSWKGLVFSLIAANRNAEALGEINKIPAETRRLLESDIEWVQGVASLYIAVGDTQRATLYVRRVESYYLLHRAQTPAGLEVQHAWLLYNLGDDRALYPVLTALDSRPDLTADQRQQVQTIWGNWAVRRANKALDDGQLQRGVQILEAASQDYPNNMTVRFAFAGVYARLGRWEDALAVYKATPMSDATSSDYQGAIGAALVAKDMAQAEIWLRVALGRFPSDPAILGLAARFEQARGNTQRASDFWRAALAAAPAGAPVKTQASGLAAPLGGTQTPSPGATRRLLDPRLDASPSNEEMAPLPSYKPHGTAAPYTAPARQVTTPTNNPLPMPSELNPAGSISQGQGTGHSAPVFVAPGSNSARGQMSTKRTPAGSLPLPRTGRVDLPASEENIESIGPLDAESKPAAPPGKHKAGTTLQTNSHLASEPMNQLAAEAQARFAAETDSQLTAGYSTHIHNLSNAPAAPVQAFKVPAKPPSQAVAPAVEQAPILLPALPAQGTMTLAQYAPSAQDAASGAYSAPQTAQTTAPVATVPTPAPTPHPAPAKAKPSAAKSNGCAAPKRHPQARKKAQSTRPKPQPQPAQTLANAPLTAAPAETQAPANEAPVTTLPPPPLEAPQAAPAENPSATGLSDQELEQRNLPPLRGPWIRVQRQAAPLSPREQAEQQLTSIESGYSGWLGGSTLVNYRSGAAGYDQLAAIEAPFEASAPLGYHARITVIPRPVFLDSGQADGTAVQTVKESESSTSCLVTIPRPIGTYVASQNFTPCTSPSIGTLLAPAQQNAYGLGGELQLSFPHMTIAGGYTPYYFLVSNITARFQWKPMGGPVTFSFVRDSVKDSQLSYAGLRDPAGETLATKGQIWGGVIANQGEIELSNGDEQSGYYFSAGGQYITGYNVQQNRRFDATGGAYWRVIAKPEYGNLRIGANFFAMHYKYNQNAFTHGMGGYFSPQAFFIGNVPFTWDGHSQTRWHYNLTGAIGLQAFQENSTPLWPLAADKSLETSQNNPKLPDLTRVGANYDFQSQVAYQIGEHWFTGIFLSANNTRDYTFTSVGFFVRYTFRKQPSTATAPTGLFPADGPRPFTVP